MSGFVCKNSGDSSFIAAGDLSGDSSSQIVVGIQGREVSDDIPVDGYVFIWNESESKWEVSGSTTDFCANGDLRGNTALQTVVGIQGKEVSNAVPSDGYIFVWNESESKWEPTAGPNEFVASGDLDGTTSSQTVIGIQGKRVVDVEPSDGYLLTWNESESQWEPAIGVSEFIAGGDLDGNYSSQTVIGLQGRDVSDIAPSDGYALTWNESESKWEPVAIADEFSANGDLDGNYSSQTVIGLQERDVSDVAPSDGYVLTWNESESRWEPTVGPSQFIADGDLDGDTSSQTVIGLQGRDVSSSVPSDGYVFTWNESEWVPMPSEFVADGDLDGNSTSQTVIGIRNKEVSDVVPLDGYALTWNEFESKWKPKKIVPIYWTKVDSIDFNSTAASTSTIIMNSDLSTIIGKTLRVLDAEGVEYQDSNNQLGGWNGLTGINSDVLNIDGKIFVNIIDDGDGYHLNIYSNQDRTTLIAHSAKYTTIGTVDISQDNNSGISGTVTINSVIEANTAIYVEFYKLYTVYSLTDTLMTVKGPALSIGTGNIRQMWWGIDEKFFQIDLLVPGDFAKITSIKVIENIGKYKFIWHGPTAKVTNFSVWMETHAGGTSPIVNLSVGGSKICSTNSNNGLTIATAKTWYNTSVDLHADRLLLTNKSAIEATTTQGTITGGDSNLAISISGVLDFITPNPISIPLEADFWQSGVYFDADYGLNFSGGDVTSWNSLIGSYTAIPGLYAPSISTIGSQKAIKFDVVNTECMICDPLAILLDGNDTTFTIAMHIKTITVASQQTFVSGTSTTSSIIYYWLRDLNTNAFIATGRDGGAATSGSLSATIANDTEYTLVYVRYGDTYDIAINGIRVVTGGNLALGSLPIDKFTIGARIISNIEYSHGNMFLRRLALISGCSITDAQLVILDTAWRGH